MSWIKMEERMKIISAIDWVWYNFRLTCTLFNLHTIFFSRNISEWISFFFVHCLSYFNCIQINLWFIIIKNSIDIAQKNEKGNNEANESKDNMNDVQLTRHNNANWKISWWIKKSKTNKTEPDETNDDNKLSIICYCNASAEKKRFNMRTRYTLDWWQFFWWQHRSNVVYFSIHFAWICSMRRKSPMCAWSDYRLWPLIIQSLSAWIQKSTTNSFTYDDSWFGRIEFFTIKTTLHVV